MLPVFRGMRCPRHRTEVAGETPGDLTHHRLLWKRDHGSGSPVAWASLGQFVLFRLDLHWLPVFCHTKLKLLTMFCASNTFLPIICFFSHWSQFLPPTLCSFLFTVCPQSDTVCHFDNKFFQPFQPNQISLSFKHPPSLPPPLALLCSLPLSL